MSLLNEYKCPSCGGSIEFDSSSQKLKCPYCGTEFEVNDLVSYNEQINEVAASDTEWESNAGNEWQSGETDGMLVYTCNSCGGEIVTDATTAASSCPFCGNPVVMSGQLSGGLKPDLIIPFKKSKEEAKEALRRHMTGKKLLPAIFRDENHIDEIKGVYVPFWLFDADVDADCSYKATTVRMWSDRNYNYTETSYYSVLRSGDVGFADIPSDASTKVGQDLMESIEPFDMSEAVEFSTAYLSGFFADKYDITLDENRDHINDRVKKSTESMFLSTVQGYSSVTPDVSGIRYRNSRAKYALLPVWLLNTTWNGQQFKFAMNGQTGKFVGDLPADEGAYRKMIITRTVILAVVIYIVGFLVNMFL